jgi:mannosyltransferase
VAGGLARGDRFSGAISALALAAVTAVFMCWGVGRPALWIDESASVIATQRGWRDLWTLHGGYEAPMVPYYALLKLCASTITFVAPRVIHHPELLYRLPSVVATVIAAGALAWWLARQFTVQLAVAAVAVFMLTVGVSRYAQEARSYAFVLLAAVVSAIAWWRLAHDRRPRWVFAYAASVAFLITAHLLAFAVVAGHLVAAVAIPGTRRWPVLWRTMIGAGIGVLSVSPLVVMALQHGHGPNRDPEITPDVLLYVFVNLFAGNTAPLLGIGAVLVVALVGLSQVFAGKNRSIARFAATWAIVPLIVMVPVVLLRPNLLVDRYLIGVLPAWTILGGLGILAIEDLAARVAPVAGVGAALVVIAAIAVAQAESLAQIRTAAGHGEDLRPALRLVQRSELGSPPIAVAPFNAAIESAPYVARSFEDRFTGLSIQRNQDTIWPTPQPIADSPRMLLLLRASISGRCKERQDDTPETHARRCMSAYLQEHYRITSAEPGGRAWTVITLERIDRPEVPRKEQVHPT